MATEPTREELEAAHCWEADDRVPGRPDVTAWRRAARLHHARWREARDIPIGSQPIAPRPGARPARPVGSRIAHDHALATGATFVTPAALAAARRRDEAVERHQSIDHQRTWADLLWSPTLAFNLFGDLADDLELADVAVHRWWPDAPGTVSEVRFVHSPGRLDPSYLNSLRQFDAAFVLDLGDGSRGLLAVDTMYHERMKPELAKPENAPRNLEVAHRADAFADDALALATTKDELCELWLEHLLLLSMLQHPTDRWAWGGCVVVHPAGNGAIVDALARYEALLTDASTFASATVEDLLGAGALPEASARANAERYLID